MVIRAQRKLPLGQASQIIALLLFFYVGKLRHIGLQCLMENMSAKCWPTVVVRTTNSNLKLRRAQSCILAFSKGKRKPLLKNY